MNNNIITSEKLEIILEKINSGKKLGRSEKIWFQNIEGVRKSGIKYMMSDYELREYSMCMNNIEYFAEKYIKIFTDDSFATIKLRDYQKEAIEHFQKNRFSIFLSSRQMGSTTFLIICFLHDMLFSKNKYSVIFSLKISSSVELMKKLKDFYKNLPFFLKMGVNNWAEKNIVFENGCKLKLLNDSPKMHDQKLDNILLYDFSHFNNAENLYYNIIPFLDDESKMIIHSSPNGNFFYKMVEDSERKEGDPMKNLFKTMKIYYWQLAGRDQKWIDERIKYIGKETFDREYGLSFYSEKLSNERKNT
jgi:hypothetical protein